jgi:hypothetical protein
VDLSPASNDPLRLEVLEYLEHRFGVPPSAFDGATFTEGAGGEIWVASHGAAEALGTRRPPGLRALRRSPDGLKPTSAFLVSIGPAIVSSRVDVDDEVRLSLLLGRRLTTLLGDGYVALSYGGSVFGCGLVANNVIRCLVPTGRRQELLDVLAGPAGRRAPEM